MSSSTQPTPAQPGEAVSSTPDTSAAATTPVTTTVTATVPAAVPAPEATPEATPDAEAAKPSAEEASPWADTVAVDPADQVEPVEGEAPEATDTAAGGQHPPKSSDKNAGKNAGEGSRVDVQAVAAALKELFPALFSGPAKPLKLRVQADIQQRAPGKFSKQQLSAFLRRYTGGTGYLIGLTKAKQRFDLDGQPAGEITDEHREAAQQELVRRRGVTETRRADEERGRQERAQLLRDFSRTTLTPANFCALKGLTQEQLDAQLALAREEAAQQPPRPARDDRPPRGGDRRPQGQGRPGGDRRAEGGQRPPRGEGQGQGRPEGGRRPPRRNG
ncbi:ProQ/FinO family protein [Roseateles sp. YR242]|uniref:ProQ/FinO family protein n=1 Tax=Roseateles sp. YR242 TaxID=1855305 RepID=UPI0011603B1F|nr:ProQ/FinO family protein [Roseateles sp. YR242]